MYVLKVIVESSFVIYPAPYYISKKDPTYVLLIDFCSMI